MVVALCRVELAIVFRKGNGLKRSSRSLHWCKGEVVVVVVGPTLDSPLSKCRRPCTNALYFVSSFLTLYNAF